jgi:hypothetical protein
MRKAMKCVSVGFKRVAAATLRSSRSHDGKNGRAFSGRDINDGERVGGCTAASVDDSYKKTGGPR